MIDISHFKVGVHYEVLITGMRVMEKSEQRIRTLVSQAEASPKPDAQIQFLMVKLRKQLDKYQGKKVYGYLPKSIKATVNEIVAVLSGEPTIAELYKEWDKVNREKLSLYYENKDPTVPLVDNREFHSIKDVIIGNARSKFTNPTADYSGSKQPYSCAGPNDWR